ncbi:MAG: dihydrofolate reductase FolA [Pseudomonadota bacterium]|jgi:dihydrofolate reductase
MSSVASPQIVVIAALSNHRVLGLNGRMPWHLPPDLQHFKHTTMGCRMVMGHTTFAGFGGRLLPGREHVVLSRHPLVSVNPALRYLSSFEAAIDFSQCPPLLAETRTDQIFVIGGAQIYTLALSHPKVRTLILTHINLNTEGDAFFPPLGREWHITEQSPLASYQGLGYQFITYER